jgi:hypothetical protein
MCQDPSEALLAPLQTAAKSNLVSIMHSFHLSSTIAAEIQIKRVLHCATRAHLLDPDCALRLAHTVSVHANQLGSSTLARIGSRAQRAAISMVQEVVGSIL